MNNEIFRATAEQLEILNKFQDGSNLKIHAFAGTGKTTTLEYLASNTERRGLYIAFNSRVAKEAKKRMPDNMVVSTIHGLAWKWANTTYSVEKLISNPNYSSIKNVIQIPHIEGFSTYKSASTILKIISRFCQSDSQNIMGEHIPWNEYAYRYDFEILAENKDDLLQAAQQAWREMLELEAPIGLGHDGYLKHWANSRPQLDFDFIFVDEAQDLSPVMLGVIKGFPKQKIIVGDSQQQIYEWRGAVDAMQQDLDAIDCFLTATFRFGENVACLANDVLTALDVKKKIFSKNSSGTVLTHDLNGEADAILFRTNSELIGMATEHHKSGLHYHIVDPNNNIKESVEDYFRLNDGKWGRSQTFEGFNSWKAVEKIAKQEETNPFRGFVDLFESHAPEKIHEAVNASKPKIGKTYPSLSTVHQAKGLEWDCVQLRGSFGLETKPERLDYVDEELRLLYVALTRAKRELQIPESLKEKINRLGQKNLRFAVIDLETTGLSPDAGDRLTEIGIVIWENGEIVDRFQSLINPQIPIPSFVQQLTGITNKMVETAPKSEEILPFAMSFVGGIPLVAHNASFERKFLNSELGRINKEYHVDLVCTLLASRRLFPNLNCYKLGDLVREFSLPKGQAHRALSDAEMTGHLLTQIHKTFQSSVKNNETFSADALLRICRGSPKQFRDSGIETAVENCMQKYSSEKYTSFDFSKVLQQPEKPKSAPKIKSEKTNTLKKDRKLISNDSSLRNVTTMTKVSSKFKIFLRRFLKALNFCFFGIPLLGTAIVFFTEDQKVVAVIMGLVLLGMWYGVQQLINWLLH